MYSIGKKRNADHSIHFNRKEEEYERTDNTWWCHQMETFFALLALCARYSPVNGESPSQNPVTRSFNVSFDLRLNKRLSKQSRRKGFETPSRSLWRHFNDMTRNRWIEERRRCYINGHLFSRELVVSIYKQENVSQLAKFMGPTWGPPGSCRPQMGTHVGPMNPAIRDVVQMALAPLCLSPCWLSYSDRCDRGGSGIYPGILMQE